MHHINVYECDPKMDFDDSDLPDGLCEALSTQVKSCTINIAVSWGLGGENVKNLFNII